MFSAKSVFECTVPNFEVGAGAVDHPGGGQAAEDAGGGAVIGVGAKLLLFSRQQLRDAGISRAEAEFPIKPKGARFDGFLVMKAELIGINNEERDAEQLVKQPQPARVQPRCLAFAESVIEVEADLHLLEIIKRFDVTDGEPVLIENTSVIGSHRQAMFRQNARDEDFDATAQLGAVDIRWIAIGEAMKL